MKKILLIAAMVLGFAVAADAQGWRVGARVGSGVQGQAEYSYSGSNYIEGRFGLAYYYGGMLTADFTALHNWNVCTMDWTPSVGQWFFDAGVGLTVGGCPMQVYAGDHQSGTLSFRGNLDCEELADALAKQGIAVRAGLHCAPLAHESAGTLDTGTVRLSYGPEASFGHTASLLNATARILS